MIRALLVAEQFALEEVLGQGGAVDGDELARLGAGRRLVDGPRHLLLAGARLAEDEHGRRGVGDVPDQLEHVVHPRALAQHVLERVPVAELAAQGGHLVLERPLPQGPLDQEAECCGSAGLVRKSYAPIRMAWTASFTPPWPVVTITVTGSFAAATSSISFSP